MNIMQGMEMADQLNATRRRVKELLGVEYDATIQPYILEVRQLMERSKSTAIEAGMSIAGVLVKAGHHHSALVVIAATMEIILQERSPLYRARKAAGIET